MRVLKSILLSSILSTMLISAANAGPSDPTYYRTLLVSAKYTGYTVIICNYEKHWYNDNRQYLYTESFSKSVLNIGNGCMTYVASNF